MNSNKLLEVQKEYRYLESKQKLELNSKEKYWVNTLDMEAVPDTGIIAFELIRNKDNAVSSNHFGYMIKDFNNTDLALSDIVLAEKVDVSSDKSGTIKRKNINILPNPANTFTSTNDVFIYYEVYNLDQDSNNKTHFEQRIKINKIEKTNVIDDIFSAVSGLFGSAGNDEVILTTDYQSYEKNTQVYLQLDMNNYPAGDYKVTVSVLDKHSGIETSEETTIYWRD
jgi:hypothetical protein